MAVVALTNEYLALNATDLSNNIKGAVLTVDTAALDATVMSDGWQVQKAGVKSGTLQIDFLDDFATGETDAVLWPLFGTLVTFEVRPDAGAVSTSNPKYTGSVLISSITVGGKHGELPMKSLTFPTSGTVARATS